MIIGKNKQYKSTLAFSGFFSGWKSFLRREWLPTVDRRFVLEKKPGTVDG